MSTSDKLTYLNETKQELKEAINNLGGNIDNTTTFRNYAQELDTIYSNLPKVSDTGTEVTLTPTLKGKLGIVEKGNSTQETTTGKNLCSNAIAGGDGNSNLDFTVNQSLIQATFTISFKTDVALSDNSIYLFVNGTNKGKVGSITGSANTKVSATVILSTDNYNALHNATTGIIRVYKSNAGFQNIEEAQIENGSTATSYEQYTGGIPAPNPNYSFPIKSVTGNNNVLVNNGNILDNVWQLGKLNLTTGEIESSTTRIVSTNYQAVKPSTTYTFGDTTFTKQVCFYKSDKTFRSGATLQAGQTQSINPTANDYYIRVCIIYDGTGVTPDINTKLALVEGTTEYPYATPQTLPLNLGNIELNKIGNFNDLIFKAVNGNSFYDSLTSEQKALLTYGKWYKHEEIGKLILDGTESSSLWTTGTVTGAYRFYYNITTLAMASEVVVLSNLFKGIKYNDRNAEVSKNNTIYSNGTNIGITTPSITTVAELQTVFQSTNFKMIYVKAEATDIEITDTNLINQLEDIDKMSGYNGTTIITSTYDSNNAQMIIQASALKGN